MSWREGLKQCAPDGADLDSLVYSTDCVIRLCRHRLDKLAQKIKQHTSSADFAAVSHRLNTFDHWALDALQAEAGLTTAQVERVRAAMTKLGKEYQSPDARAVKIDLTDQLVYTLAAHGFELNAGHTSPLLSALKIITESELPELRLYIKKAIRTRKKAELPQE